MQSRVVPYTLVGFGFRPTDEELVFHYLKHKLLGDDQRVHVMPDIELCHVEPWDVPGMLAESVIRFNDPEWFFFSRVDYKYSNSKRVNRKTKCGYWKTTGKERHIRYTDTNTVIGTKKTLVFYEGPVSHGVKSNWVIHEYHDATFHESQRTFVLCRLIKKSEKTAEGEIDALICDEGEPSRSIVSDYGNLATEGIPSEGTFTEIGTIFQEVHQAENCFSPIQQSPIGIGQEEASLPNFPFYNAYFRNENIQTPFETTVEYEFLNSIIGNEGSTNTFINSFTQSESLRRDYESSDTDVEVISKQDGDIMDTSTMNIEYSDSDEYQIFFKLLQDDNIMDISTMNNEYPDSDEYQTFFKSLQDGDIMDTSTMNNEYPDSDQYQMSKRFKSTDNIFHGDRRLVSSNHEANQEKNESIYQDDLWGLETSSCDSTGK